MKILHGTWIPSSKTDFIQSGSFYLWIEIPITAPRARDKQKIHRNTRYAGNSESSDLRGKRHERF